MDRPIVFITIAFAGGIILANSLPIPLWLMILFLAVFLALSLYGYRQKLDLSLFVLVLAFLLGAFMFQVNQSNQLDELAPLADKGYLTLSGTVDDQPKVRNGRLVIPFKTAAGSLYVYADSAEAVAYGDKLKVRGALTEFEGNANPLLQRSRKMYGLRANWLEKTGSGGHPLKQIAAWFDRRFNEVLAQIMPQSEAALAGSIVMGTSVSDLPDEIKSEYRKAGVVHLLVVSGTQVSILIGVCLALTRTVGLPNWAGIAATSFFNLLLVIATGAGASVLRAALMGETMLVGLLFEREKEFYTSLCLSALILMLFDPPVLFDIGFQLSFAATWALVYIAPVLQKRLPSLLAITLAPLMATMPIIAYYFSQLSLVSVISNLLVLPWVECLTLLGFFTTVVGFIFLPAAQVLGGALWLLVFLLDRLVNYLASLPWACYYIPAPSLAAVGGYYLVLIGLVEVLRKEGVLVTKKRVVFALVLLLSVAVWDRAFSAPASGGRQLTVTVIDVGQGDSILVEPPDGKKVLIDGGGLDRGEGREGAENDPVGARIVVPFLQRKGIDHLDLVILTHPHADHLGGLNKVLEEVKVDEVLDGGQVYRSRAYEHFKQLIAANKIKYELGRAGQVLDLDDGIKGYILNPRDPLLGDTNSDSIVMRLVYGDVSFLLTGDLGKPGEERIMSYPIDLTATVLKVGHHGSSTSTTDEFLRAVHPKYAVISVGKHNRYRHPAASTLKRLQSAGVEVYRTDENGAVVMTTDGKELTVVPQK